MTQKLFQFALILCLGVSSHFAYAGKHNLELQSSSMMGFAHLSYGYTFAEKHTVSIGFGYVPELSHHEEMTMTSLKYRYESGVRIPFSLFGQAIEFSPFNFGVATITGHQDEIYSDLPEYIPDGYYFPTARRVLINYQANFKLPYQFETYIDWSILDVGLINYVRNAEFYNDHYKFLGIEGIVSYGVGVRKVF